MPKKITIETVRSFVEENSECELVSEAYVSSKEKLTFRCKCGEVFMTTFTHFKNSNQRQCKECGYKKTARKLKFSYDEVKEYIEKTTNCKLLSKTYFSQLDKLEIRCECGNVFHKTLKDFKNGQNRCNECAGKVFYTIEDVAEYVREHSSCELVSKSYKNQYQKLRFACSCGNVFFRTFNDFKNQQAYCCPICSKRKSRSEKAIKKWLDENNVKNIHQYRFCDCRDTLALPFDFYLPQHNTCIEYDGELHYMQTTLNNDLDTQRLHDRMKDEYCKAKNIKLIRIPYWEKDNIENILKSAIA